MKDQNYDAIGRCVVAKRSIECLIDKLLNLRSLALRESIHLMGVELVMHESMVECAATLSTETRRIYDAIYSLALEHNRWAPLAEHPLIEITRHPLLHMDLVQKEFTEIITEAGHATPHT